MGTPTEHKSKAAHNLAFLHTISDDYPDWLTTAAFYVAVQLVEQLLAERGQHCADHHQRKTSVRRDFPSIQRAYNALYNASLVARYDPPSEVLPVAQVRSELIGKHLEVILKFSQSHAKTK
jgi:hypothetical protein